MFQFYCDDNNKAIDVHLKWAPLTCLSSLLFPSPQQPLRAILISPWWASSNISYPMKVYQASTVALHPTSSKSFLLSAFPMLSTSTWRKSLGCALRPRPKKEMSVQKEPGERSLKGNEMRWRSKERTISTKKFHPSSSGHPANPAAITEREFAIRLHSVVECGEENWALVLFIPYLMSTQSHICEECLFDCECCLEPIRRVIAWYVQAMSPWTSVAFNLRVTLKPLVPLNAESIP